MAGHPGAGKTFVLNNVKSGSIDPRWVNTDKVYPIFKKWWSTDWPKISSKVKTVNVNQLANYINSILPLAIDGTANKVSTLMRRKSVIESFGYDTMMIFVNTLFFLNVLFSKRIMQSLHLFFNFQNTFQLKNFLFNFIHSF